MKIWTRILIGLALLMLVATNLPAQRISATLTGTVIDPSNAVVPQAQIKLRNESSGSERTTVTNAEGYFTFASLDVGDYTYELTVTAKGFLTYKAPGIALSGGDSRNINVVLKVGSTSETVEVTGVADVLTPVDSGEKSSTLTTTMLQNFITVGSNAAEFIKIMPGFGVQNGTQNKANFTGEVIGINGNGDGGSQSPLNNAYTYNGLPTNSLDITADGTHVSDPGCNCATPVNPNSDMIAEFKVLTSNFSAENQKGPAVITSVARSGGKDFHGTAFFYARDYVMNANDWLNNYFSLNRPQSKYFYPGGNFSGPAFIPGHFNKNRDKLFFFTGYEYFYQTLDTGLLTATVPTPGMIAGNFTPSELSKLGKIDASGGAPSQLNATLFPGGIIPAAQLNSSGQALAGLIPGANANPNTDGGYNYAADEIFNQNSMQWMSRVDYNISDNTKLYFRYNMQRETQQFPVGLWWRNSEQVPYPTPILGKNLSDSYTASLTHVFSPTMTNEFVFGYTYIGFPNVFKDPSKVDPHTVGYEYHGIFGNIGASPSSDKHAVDQVPAFTGWGGSELATILNPGGFEVGGVSQGLYADKWLPQVSDNLTKVWGTHTIKAGFYWEWIRNSQPDNQYSNGDIIEANWGGNTTGNAYGDMLTGRTAQYNETNLNRVNDIEYTTVEGFVQDSWKVTRKVTLELGLRISHFSPWQDRLGDGYSEFVPSLYNSSDTNPLDYTGFTWHAKDPSIPNSVFPSRAAFWAPRVGIAYDLFGKGNTVLRGGWGRFYYHSGQFTTGLGVTGGELSASLTGASTFAQIDNTSPSSALVALSVQGLNPKDDNDPYTDSYSVTVSQKVPWSSLVEVSYVGNRSRDLLNTGAVGNDINPVPLGTMLNVYSGGVLQNPNNLGTDAFRPYTLWGDLDIVSHNEYANYNAMQITWLRSKGRYNINANYAYGKAMGIVGGLDNFNVAANYGPQAGDRRQIFNSAYSIEIGDYTKNKLAGGFINGWQLSGIAQVQSGANLTANAGNGSWSFASNNNLTTQGFGISNESILGTTEIQLNPYMTCNPKSGLGSHQFINGSCYMVPFVVGQNGPLVTPAIYGPAFVNFDLGLFKNFQFSESKKLQFRINGYNFLNHPLYSFPGGFNNLDLNFASTGSDIGRNVNPNFGIATVKQGHRIVQLALKFFF
jgi:hypothetical protein